MPYVATYVLVGTPTLPPPPIRLSYHPAQPFPYHLCHTRISAYLICTLLFCISTTSLLVSTISIIPAIYPKISGAFCTAGSGFHLARCLCNTPPPPYSTGRYIVTDCRLPPPESISTPWCPPVGTVSSSTPLLCWNQISEGGGYDILFRITKNRFL